MKLDGVPVPVETGQTTAGIGRDGGWRAITRLVKRMPKSGSPAHVIWILLVILGVSATQASAQPAPQPVPTAAELARREALLRKTLADEYFIADRRAEAEAEYERAQSLLDDYFPTSAEAATSAAIRFLRADIRFRRAMLKRPGADFFTSVAGPTVISPVAGLRRLRERSEQIERLASEITGALNNPNPSHMGDQIAAAENQLNQRLADLTSGQWGNAIADYDRRIRDFRAELNSLAGQSEAHYSTIAQQYAALRRKEEEGITLLVEETAKAAGLPTGLEGVGGGAASQIPQIITRLASDALRTPEAQAALRDVIVGVATLRDNGGDPGALSALLTSPITQVRGAFRDRFFALYSAVGAPLYAGLTADQQNRMQTAVANRKPLLALMDLMYTKPVIAEAAKDFLEDEGSALLDALVQEPTGADLERAMVDWLRRTNATRERAFDGVMNQMTSTERVRVRQLLAEQALAGHANVVPKLREQVAHHVGAAAQARNAPGTPEQIHKPEGSDAVNTYAVGVLGAVGQTYPPAAVAAAALRIGHLMEATYEAIDKINEASAENQRIATREAYVRELIDQAIKNREVAEYESAMAQARADYARSAFKRWEEVVSARLAANDLRRRYIALRLPLLWFHAEMARRDFAALDRSVGVWTGAWQGTGALRREMLRDAQMTRLALDDDIQLYQWLAEERDVESRRDDLERLNVHWQKVEAIAGAVLANYDIETGGGQIGTVVPLSDGNGIATYLGSNEVARFRAWQAAEGRNAQGQPVDFVLSIPITPGTTLGGLAVTPRHGLRTVAVEVGLVTSAGNQTAAANVEVSHPGMAFVPVWDNQAERFRYLEETMRPVEVVAGQPGVITIPQYTSRWQGGVPHGPFDGYGLFTTWRIRVKPDGATLAARDVIVRFVTQYNHNVATAPTMDFGLETFAGESGSVVIERERLAPLTENHALHELVRQWATTAPVGDPTWPRWRHGLPMSSNTTYWQDGQPTSNPTPGRN